MKKDTVRYTPESTPGRLVAQIRGLHPIYESVITNLRRDQDRLNKCVNEAEIANRPDYWQIGVACNSAIRIRQIIEFNFNFIETLSLLASARYVFELTVWLKLISSRGEYAVAYYGLLLKKQKEHAEGYVRQLKREIELLEQLEEEDARSAADAIGALDRAGESMSDEEVLKLGRNIGIEADRRAARQFSLFADQAKHFGFGYTADLIRSQAIDKAEGEHSRATNAYREFLGGCHKDVRRLVEQHWNWSDAAKAVSMSSEYAFIYSYASRLLHATPASVLTDKKQLEENEIVIFLRFVHASMLDVLDLLSDMEARLAVNSA